MIPAFYAGQSVFVTGATGFLGKVFIKKILRSCPDVREIFLLMRSKKELNINERLQQMLNLPMQSQCYKRRLRRKINKERQKRIRLSEVRRIVTQVQKSFGEESSESDENLNENSDESLEPEIFCEQNQETVIAFNRFLCDRIEHARESHDFEYEMNNDSFVADSEEREWSSSDNSAIDYNENEQSGSTSENEQSGSTSDNDVGVFQFHNNEAKEVYITETIREWALEGGVISMTKLNNLLLRLRVVHFTLPKNYKSLLKTSSYLNIIETDQASLFHLAQECLFHGALDKISAFLFENYLKSLKSLLKSGYKPLQQAARRDLEKTVSVSVHLPTNDKEVTLSRRHYCDGEIIDGSYFRSISIGNVVLQFVVVKLVPDDVDNDNICYDIGLTKWLIEVNEDMKGETYWPPRNVEAKNLVRKEVNAGETWPKYRVYVKRYHDLNIQLSNCKVDRKLEELNCKINTVITNQGKLNRCLLPQEKKIVKPHNMPSLPFRNESDVQAMEKWLCDSENKIALCDYLTSFGSASDERKTATIIMQKLMYNSLAKNYNFDGHGEKRGLKTLQLWTVIEGSLSLKFPDSDLDTALKTIKSWLRNASGRKQEEYIGSDSH